MAKNNITELVFILDRSGSMAGLESDIIGADRAVDYLADSQGTGVLYETVLAAVGSLRRSAPLAADWGDAIKGDNLRKK